MFLRYPVLKEINDRALGSYSTIYELAMRIIVIFFMNSVAQLEADISTYFHEGLGYVEPLEIFGLNFNIILGHRSLTHPVIFVLLSLLVPDL